MAGTPQDTNWPMPQFYFRVAFSGMDPFQAQEVSGLDTQTQIIEYRAGSDNAFSNVKMPGLVQSSNVTVKKAVMPQTNALWDWYNQIKMNTIKRQSVTISLLDQDGKETMVWTLRNAWPVKITASDLNESAEIAIESIELAHEGITVSHS